MNLLLLPLQPWGKGQALLQVSVLGAALGADG